jgi:cytidylate kinase
VIRSVVTIGGPPGSGKSTAGRLVAERLGLEYRSAGEVFRAEARRRGLTVEEFNRYAEDHPEVDRDLDQAMQSSATPGRLLEGRVQGALCRRNGVAVHYVLVTATVEERVRRLASRDGQSLAEARERLRTREESELRRYRRDYGIDLEREAGDLSVDSTSLGPAEVASAIVDYIRAHEPAGLA